MTVNCFEKLKELVYIKLEELNQEQLKNGWYHLSSVAVLSGLLAIKRGLDSKICQTAGILHDLWLYCNLPLEVEIHKKHDEYGAGLAKEMLLNSGCYSKEEIEQICYIISCHNQKDVINGEYEELLKDADALQHNINNSDYDQRYNYHGRIEPILKEFCILK